MQIEEGVGVVPAVEEVRWIESSTSDVMMSLSGLLKEVATLPSSKMKSVFF